MENSKQNYDDEIDLFELFETLWDGKWLIGAFISASIIVGGVFVVFKTESAKTTPVTYESTITYSISTLPTFIQADAVKSDFRELFYNPKTFTAWKTENPDTDIKFDDFSRTQSVDGYLLSRDYGSLLAALSNDSSLSIKSNQPAILNDFYLYMEQINSSLKDKYRTSAQAQLNLIKLRMEELSSSSASLVDSILAIDRFIYSVENGSEILSIAHPTKPRIASSPSYPKPTLIIALSIVLGGMLGVVYVLVNSAVRKRKQQKVPVRET